jgi:stage II sporulation protein E
MFQNIIDEEIREDKSYDTDNEKKRIINLKNLFSVSDFVLCAISFMVSMVSFNGEFAPFGLAIFAAICSNRIPSAIVYISTCLGTLIGFGANGFLSYLLTTLIFIVMTLIFRPRFEEDRNEKQKLGLYILLSSFIVQAGKMLFTMFLFYDLISSFVFAILTYIFYKIFVNSITVIKEYGIKKAFTVEEVIGASLLLAIAIYSINKLNVFGLSVSNVLSIMLVLFLGWKNGMLVGATAGITIGMVLGIIGSSSPVLVASYAISGMIAGILNKLGRIGVIIGFCLGNAVLTYVANGNTVPIITIREILIASLGLLLLPKTIDIDISDIVGKAKFLPTTGGILEGDKETIYKLNTVSETISEIAKSYSEVAATTIESDEELSNESKDIFKEELLNNIEDFSDNLLYEDLIYEDSILYSVYELLEEKEEINKEELIKIFEDYNNYIIGINEDDEGNSQIQNDINQIVKAINHTYRINKLNLIWKQKEANNKKVLANQLRRSI